ncbi:hypothetical protein HOK51_05965 [Candidatus Woesearchaeota archaeon]|jgi:hypothetical protein|nr:hypothetical protein [Candidatus Woesearchaeota archaeon]MBT6519373.1 hypothetical protein [Candidatus Woesearchaeota archaeon]MBT7368599.1 hypothetical protein [Candidatus Woesearchaeota archaeon]
MAEGEFFVQIPDSTEIRRALLENSKQIITVLRRYEYFKDKRIQKQELMSRLKNVNNEIQVILQKLERELPETNLRIQLKIESKRLKPAVSGVHRKRTISKTGKSEDLLKLEQDLQSIEGKLSGLKR